MSPPTSPDSTPPSASPSQPPPSGSSAKPLSPIDGSTYPHLSPQLVSLINDLEMHPPQMRAVLATGVNGALSALKNLLPSQKREYLCAGLAGYGIRDPARYLSLLRADTISIPLDNHYFSEDIENLALLICYDSALVHQPATVAALLVKSLVLSHAPSLFLARARFS